MKELSSDFEVSTQTRLPGDLVCLKTSRSLLNSFIYCGAKIAANQAPCWPGWIFRAGGACRREAFWINHSRLLGLRAARGMLQHRAMLCLLGFGPC